MMILRFSPSSPFVRKVRIAAAVLGLDSEITIERADTTDPNDSLRKTNPLGKIPVIIIEDGSAIYDSRVILDYLDERAGGGKIVPRQGPQRVAALRLQALCDGILDASILTVYESRFRKPEMHEAKWLELQAGKVSRALAVLEAAPPPSDVGQALPDVGQITLVDPETGARMEADTSSAQLRRRFEAAELARRDELKRHLRGARARHVELDTDSDWLRALGRNLR